MRGFPIQPIPRLTFRVVAEILERRESHLPQPLCYDCQETSLVLIPRGGRLRCERCDDLATLRAWPARNRIYLDRLP